MHWPAGRACRAEKGARSFIRTGRLACCVRGLPEEKLYVWRFAPRFWEV